MPTILFLIFINHPYPNDIYSIISTSVTQSQLFPSTPSSSRMFIASVRFILDPSPPLTTTFTQHGSRCIWTTDDIIPKLYTQICLFFPYQIFSYIQRSSIVVEWSRTTGGELSMYSWRCRQWRFRQESRHLQDQTTKENPSGRKRSSRYPSKSIPTMAALRKPNQTNPHQTQHPSSSSKLRSSLAVSSPALSAKVRSSISSRKACHNEQFTNNELATGNLPCWDLIPLLDNAYTPDSELPYQIMNPTPPS